MSLQIRQSQLEPDIVVVEISGRLTRWPENQLDEPVIEQLLHRTEKKLVFDLAGLDQIDSSGTQLLFDCFCNVRKAGGELRLAGASARITRLFHITRLDAVLPFHATVAQACESFAVTPSSKV